jgi:hypothetical protein
LKESFKQINIYIDTKNNEMVIIPTGRIKELGIVEIEHIDIIQFPYTKEELLSTFKLSFNLCYSKVPPIPAKASALAIMLGKKNYSLATKNKKLVTITWEATDGYKICPTQKEKGGYLHLVDLTISIGHTLGYDQLLLFEKAILQASIK